VNEDPRKSVETAARARERHEPEELHTPIGWPMLLVFVIVISWGAFYYFRDLLSATGAPSDAGDRRSTVVIDPVAKADGAAVFAGNCQACHQATGQGLPGAFPPLAGSEWVTGPANTMTQIVLHGLGGPLTVRGQSYQGTMPAFSQLTDAELAAVISHVRGAWGNAAGAVTVAEVAAARKLERSTPWTATELQSADLAP